MGNKIIIAVDFDGVLVKENYPEIGRDLGARYWLGNLNSLGAELVLWTCRTEESFKEMEVWLEGTYADVFTGINTKPQNAPFDDDPRKIYANIYVDDHALGAPMKNDPRTDDPPVFDWDTAGPRLIKMVADYYNKEKTDGK